MPIIFKIFLFLLLQQGGKIVAGQKDGISIQQPEPSGDMKLVIEGESVVIEQIISLCLAEDMSSMVERETVYTEGGTERLKGTLLFRNLKPAHRVRLMERTKPLQGNNSMQWIML